MFRPLALSHRRPPRRGTSFILIVVAMLSLFAAVGTAYALYAMREARLGAARKEEHGLVNTAPQAPDPTDTVNAFFGALIYDVGDSNTDVTNGLRGHSIARSMYGRDVLNPYNTVPWAGVGTFQDTSNSLGLQRSGLANYTLVSIGGKPFLLDPEYTADRALIPNGSPGAGTPVAFDPTTRTYIGKHAGYSFPDLKDFFSAQLDPATGQVLVPSFHRDWLFGSLAPTNGNWYNTGAGSNPQGVLMTLRPRPGEHPNFPRVPPNYDGTYSGDVQNWPGGYTYVGGKFYSRNDSLWMNLGLPVITLPGNRKVQPLVAPLIIPMDGLFNASAHGNTWAVNHISYAGYGPWEVNLGAALSQAEANTVVNARGVGLQQRNTLINQRAYNPYASGPQPDYAPVAWSNSATSVAYPTGASIVGLPSFTGFQFNNQMLANHPSLYNTTEWPSTTSLAFRTFPLGDVRRLNRSAAPPDWYTQADVAAFAPNGLKGTFGFTFATGQATPASYGYRLDPANNSRALFTTRSFDLDRPKLVPNFVNRDGANGLPYGNGPGGLYKPGVVNSGTYPTFPLPATGAVTDFASQTQWRNVMAALGSVNLNRPLADYRTDPSQSLSFPGNVTAAQAALADADRQQFARDIFIRLAAATGASLTITMTPGNAPTYAVPVGLPALQYNALRYLAQLSVNIVDYIDNDDISTAFMWNSAQPTDIVYGVEKPRLVINEAYSEIVNDPTDPVDGPMVMGVRQAPAKPAQVRFWLELLNPTQALTTGATGGTTGPLNDGSVALSAYQIQIRRESRTTGAAVPDAGAFGSNQYQNLFNNPANTTGSFSSTADTIVSLDTGGTVNPNLPHPTLAAGTNPYNPSAGAGFTTLPASGIVLVGPTTAPKAGGEEFSPANGVWTNLLSPGTLNYATTSTAMGYQFDLPNSNTTFTSQEFKRHIVLLRRAANPYLRPNDPAVTTGVYAYNNALPLNPYLTVDLMDFVPAFDAVHRGKNDLTNRGARDTNATGYDPINSATAAFNRFSVGKVQPYAGHASAAITNGSSQTSPYGYNQYTFGNTNFGLASMVLAQTAAPSAGNTPKNTFGRHNGNGNNQPGVSTFVAGNGNASPFVPPTLTDTIMLPYDWLPHVDRPLVNQLELLTVRDTPPYVVTDQFIYPSTLPQPSGAPGISYEAGLARWRGIEDGIGRAMEFLTVKPYTVGVPHGGRAAGKVNLNVLQDQRVLNGLLDPQAGNGFDLANFVNNPNANTGAWNGFINSRTPVGTSTLANTATISTVTAPGQTIFEGGSQRPFMTFGAPAALPGGTTAYTNGGSIDLTLLRRPVTTMPAYLFANAGSKAWGMAGAPYTAAQPDGPLYSQAEPVRKIMNNTTTVSHNYLVFLTVGYFDVVGTTTLAPGISIPTLGAESYLTIPGDLRQKFVGIIDMSNMALDANVNQAATVQPFFTSLEQTTYATGGAGPVTLNIAYSTFNNGRLWVASDGQETEITAGMTLVLGYGAEQQLVTVTPTMTSANGILGAGQVNVTAITPAGAPVFRTAWGGTCVSNVRPGYPGPQPGFVTSSAIYKPVLPYLERLK